MTQSKLLLLPPLQETSLEFSGASGSGYEIVMKSDVAMRSRSNDLLELKVCSSCGDLKAELWFAGSQ